MTAPAPARPAPGPAPHPRGAAPIPATPDRSPASGPRFLPRTTPSTLRAFQVACWAVAILLGLAITYDATSRRSDLGGAERAADVAVAAQDLRSALGQADGAAVNSFLAGGVDRPEQRERYGSATDEAAEALIRAGRAADDATSVELVDDLQRQLPHYTGLIETARADNRQQLPLGAAYLRTASDLVRTSFDEKISQLRSVSDGAYRGEIDGLLGGFGSVPALLVAVAAVLLVGIQVWVFQRTNRLLNLGLIGASLLLAVGLAALQTLSQAAAEDGLAATEAYDELAALSAVRADAYDQQSSSTFALVDRGAREAYITRAATATNNVASRLDALQADRDLESAWTGYLELSDEVTRTDTGGDYDGARSLAFDKAPSFEQFDIIISDRADAATAQLHRELDQADTPLTIIQFAGLPLGLLIGALATWGLQQRLNDYR